MKKLTLSRLVVFTIALLIISGILTVVKRMCIIVLPTLLIQKT